MKTKNKLTVLQRSRRMLWYFTVMALVVIAISMTLARTLISNVGGFRNQLEEIASKYLEQPLRIETFDAQIIGFTPTFIFKNVSLLEKSSDKVMVKFKEARVGLSIYNSIRYRKLSPKSFVISGINLVVTQNKNNTFKVKGINVAEFDPAKNTDSEESNELSNWLFQQDKLKLENSTIHWHNSITNKVLRFSNINLLFNNSGDRHTLSGDWQLQSKMAKRFKIELDMVGDILNPASWEGAGYVKGEEVNITEFGIPDKLIPLKPASGIYNFELWADFKLGQLKEVTGATNVRNLKFNSSRLNNVIEIDKMGAVWRWDNLADGWALNIDRFHYEENKKIWPLSRVLIESHNRFQPSSVIDIYVDNLDIEDASRFLQKLKIIEQKKISTLQEMNPRGRIVDTHVRFNVNTPFSDDFLFQSELENITINPNDYVPGVENLSGSISAGNTQGSLVLNSKNSIVDLRNLFRDKIKISNLDGRLNWRSVKKEWHLSAENINVSNNDIQLNLNLNMVFPESNKSPFIDLQVNFKNGAIASARQYYPVSIMDKSLVEWLDSSLISGFVKKGGVVLQGRLDDFPYLKQNGKFEVSLESDNFVLRYLDDWPRINQASAELSFTGAGFDINIIKAKLLNSEVKNAEIYINDFTDPELVIKGNINSSTNDLFQFLVNSPIASDSRSVIEELKITGDSKVNIQVNVPLADESDNSTYYKGSIITKDSSFSLYDNIFEFNHISGKLEFTEKGFKSDNLNAICFNEPSKIRIYSQSKQSTFSHHVLLEGKFDSESVRKKFNIPWMEKSTGVAKWQGIFNFAYSTEKAEIPASIVITTDLQGVNLNLPSPLNKSEDSKLPVIIESKFISKNKNRINVTIDDGLFLSGIIKQSNDKYYLSSASINFGVNKNTKLQNDVISVQGDIRDIYLGSWLSFVKDFDFDNNSNTFVSPDLKIIFDVDSYYISDPKNEMLTTITTNENPKKSEVQYSGIDPRTVPEFSGEIRNIYYDISKVGTLSFNFEHSENGFNIKKLNLHSENFDLNSSGIWHIFPDKGKDRFLTKFTNVKFISSNLGSTLSSLGFKSVLNKGKSNSDLTVWWYDSPFEFSIDKLSAEILVNVSDGEILDIDPKSGRLLGLLSLSNLPRRLFGDFSDVFSSGLSFDSIIGQVRIANGVMSTDDILMTSSPAEIHILGETDLVKRTFDQEIKVIPNITDSTAILGGLIWGLPALIATKIFAGIIDFDEVTMRTYHITGTWDNPVITTLNEPELEPDEVTNSIDDSDDSIDEN